MIKGMCWIRLKNVARGVCVSQAVGRMRYLTHSDSESREFDGKMVVGPGRERRVLLYWPSAWPSVRRPGAGQWNTC